MYAGPWKRRLEHQIGVVWNHEQDRESPDPVERRDVNGRETRYRHTVRHDGAPDRSASESTVMSRSRAQSPAREGMVRAVYQLDRKLAGARHSLRTRGAALGSQQLQAGVVRGEHEQHGCAALSHRFELVAQVIPQRDTQIARQVRASGG